MIPTGISAFAEGKPQDVKPLTEREVFYTAESQARMSLASASQTKAFENIIYNAAIKSNTDALNLDSLGIKKTEVDDMLQAVIDKYPELYNIKKMGIQLLQKQPTMFTNYYFGMATPQTNMLR